MQKYSGLEIAVVGMAGRFPGADNIENFWENLKNGKESITIFSDEELKKSGIDVDLLNNPLYVKANGAINNIDKFDNLFFEYTPKEAGLLEPQVRIFHECCWEALEDAGCNPDKFDGLIGLYAGSSEDLKWKVGSYINLTNVSEQFEAKNFLRNSFTTLVSYKLNLKGPSYSLNTACSTSLVAVHLACQALLSGECDLSLAGGITIIPPMNSGYLYQEGMILSPDGHCRAFDAKANGTIFGNGAGVVALKRLEDAIKDNDSIYAIIKGSAINNDGLRKVGYTAPSVEGQAEVIMAAHQIADVDPESIGYVETHGTGTNLGDPVEIEGLKLAFNSNKKGFCAIGSVKTNIGHLDITAGVAGFIKTILSLKHKKIVPSINFENPNPNIDFKNSPFYVNTSLQDWKSEDILRAGVSSFGIGGTNAHVILEEAPEVTVSPSNRRYHMIMLSAKSTYSLKKARENMITFLQKNNNHQISDIAYTLQVGRKEFQYKSVCTCSNVDEAIENLSGPITDDNFSKGLTLNAKTSVIFMFSGQGSQYVDMGLELYKTESFFKTQVDKCFDIIEKFSDFDFRSILYPPTETTDYNSNDPQINQTANTQPLLFVIEYSLAKLLMHWGINPDAMIGHSIGEYVAACIADVLSLEDALKLVVERGKLIQKMPKGSMLAVQLSVKDLKPLLIEGVEIAVQNSSGMSVVGGNESCIESFTQILESKNIIYSKLHTSHAFHTQMMEPILKEFEECVRNVKLNKPQVPYMSNVTGKWITEGEVTDPLYWAKQIRNTVKFSDGINELSKINGSVYIEVGPGKSLCNLVKLHYNNKEQKVFNLLKHPYDKKPGDFYLIDALSKLWLIDVSIDWTKYYEEENRKKVNLPTYSFDRKSFVSDHSRIIDKLISGNFSSNINHLKKKDFSEWFYSPQWQRSSLYIDYEKELQTKNNWLVFVDEIGLGEQMVSFLKDFHHSVTLVSSAEIYSRINVNNYLINPNNPDDYVELFQDLTNSNNSPSKIIHLWTVYEEDKLNIEESINKSMSLGFYSLMYLAQAIGKQNMENRLFLNVISNNIHDVTGNEELSPGKSVIKGCIKVISQEFININCRSIDFSQLTKNSIKSNNQSVKQLIKELVSKENDYYVAYRGKYRWVEKYEQLKLDNQEINITKLKEKGVYIILGGLGSIGLTIAELLAEKVHAKLVLISRTKLPNRKKWDDIIKNYNENDSEHRKIKRVILLESLGAEVLTISADISDYNSMQKVVKSVELKFGQINGVIHAAGILTKDAYLPLIQTTKQMCEEQFAPKVSGLLVLERIFENKDIDFCLLTSSVSAQIAGIGFLAYASANIFIDAYTIFHNRYKKKNWISVNWDLWNTDSVYFMKEHNQLKEFSLSYDEVSINKEESKRGILQILSLSDVNQIIVSLFDLNQRLKWKMGKNKSAECISNDNDIINLQQNRPELLNPFLAPTNETEQKLSDIFTSVLGYKNIGIEDDFFELGGDSIKAINVTAKIFKTFKVEIKVSEFFKRPTIKLLSEFINKNITLEEKHQIKIKPASKKDFYPLSAGQEGIYFLQKLDRSSTVYNEIIILSFDYKSDKEHFEKLLLKSIERHESLRTSFIEIEGVPYQKIHDKVDFAIEYYESEDDETKIKNLISNFIRSFDLTKAPLMRAAIIDLGNNKHIRILDKHHIITDGTSHKIFAKEQIDLASEKKLPELKFQFKDFSEWENSAEAKVYFNKQEVYWLEEFDNKLSGLKLPYDYEKPTVQSFKGDMVDFIINENITNSIKTLISNDKISIFVFLLAIFKVFLHKISGQNDIIIGTPFLGRPHPNLLNVIGMFVNTLPIRTKISEEMTFHDYLTRVKEKVLLAMENQYYPFNRLTRKIDKNNDNPLFTTAFVFENTEAFNDETKDVELLLSNTRKFKYTNTTSKFDLILNGFNINNELHFNWTYCTVLFTRDTIQRFVNYINEILLIVIQDKDIKLKDIKIGHGLTTNKPKGVKVEFDF